MPIENHTLVNELPEFKDTIHQLKMTDAHFKKLFEEYNFLTEEIEKMEKEIVLTSTFQEEEFKKRRLLLKDSLVNYLKNATEQKTASA
ncbi:YdcH family protein [Marinomonas pollencensis]|uniref:GTP-binding protein n=1 Tax=Marinomonas pollencensis TaxID=491954 RepID=A0A3E0DX08_9GAMM|nr:DUF465 domain-containing protein [Marinomonas pollencensis]REG86621.1 hypothetical protein DFP81_101186 [Marinomonas pollencensis]